MATSIGVKLKMDGEAEFRKNLNNIVTSTKNLDKQLDILEKSFEGEQKSMEQNSKQTELLERKKEQLQKQVEEMNKALEYAQNNYEENSAEVTSWEAALAQAEAQLEATNAELKDCADYQEQVTDAQEDSTSAYEELTNTIADQETKLGELESAYVDAVLQFGEGSDEAEALAGQITDLSTELETNKGKLEDAQTALDDLKDSEDDVKSASEQLVSTISDQESELDSLRDAYIDAVLQFGEGSDEANELAGQISSLSSELQNNRAQLDNARASLESVESAASSAGNEMDDLQGELEETGSGAEELVSKFGGSFMGMADAIESAGVAGIIGIIAEALIDLGEQAIEAMNTVQEASNQMQLATLLTGDALVEAENAAYNAYLQLTDTNTSLADMEAIGGTLYTRLGLTGEALEQATLLFGQYAAATGVDGVNAVNDLVSVMRLWGLETEDDATNLETLSGIMDTFVYAQGQGQLSISDVTNSMIEQSGAWQSVGYSMNDAIALMAAYTDAGGSTSEITSAVDKAVQKLAGNTDDMGAAWNEALEMLANADDRFSVLDQTVGDTGVTISTMLGKSAAGGMADVFRAGKVEADSYRDGLSNLSNTTVDMYQSTQTADDMISQITKSFGNYEVILFQNRQAIDAQAKAWEDSAKKADTANDDMAASAEDASKVMVSEYQKTINALAETPTIGATDALDKLPTKATGAFGTVIGGYNNVSATLASTIPMYVSAPVVRYYKSGNDENTVLTPYSAGRYTFARGYDEAMILTAPTIFGASGNSLLVGGDRPGNEIVVGEQHLLDMMKKVIGREVTVNVYGAEGQSVSALADVVIDKLQREILGSEAVYA